MNLFIIFSDINHKYWKVVLVWYVVLSCLLKPRWRICALVLHSYAVDDNEFLLLLLKAQTSNSPGAISQL